jgi:hypothetical protein
MGVCAFCGDETTHVSRPMAGRMRLWAHRNAQRAHTHRETILLPSSGYPSTPKQYQTPPPDTFSHKSESSH